jgi:SAM-dependent methyltransferase
VNGLTAPKRCIICDLLPRRSCRLSNGAWLLRCPRCRLGWWDWPAFDPAAFYDREYFQSADATRGYDDYSSLEVGLRCTARGRLRRIRRLLVPAAGAERGGRRLLDVGCGTGTFLDEARRAGWAVHGVEVSEYAAREARRRGLDVTCAASEEVAPEVASLDCVTLWDAIEHVRDPLGVLVKAAQALRPGGVLALSTGDITSLCARLSGPRWHLFNLPEHLFFFSPRSLRELLRRAGCRGARLTREVNWVPVAYVLERVQKSAGSGFVRRRPEPHEMTRPDRAGAGWIVPATLFDVLGVYAIRVPVSSRRA